LPVAELPTAGDEVIAECGRLQAALWDLGTRGTARSKDHPSFGSFRLFVANISLDLNVLKEKISSRNLAAWKASLFMRYYWMSQDV
jgi:hypothetical protein